MFGKPEWFRGNNQRGWLIPKTWKGLAYYLAWGLVAFLPTALLSSRHLWPETVVWCVVAGAAFWWDYRQTLRGRRQHSALDNVLVIDDQGDESVSTARYELTLKR